VDAVDLIATHGWKLLPEYRFDPPSGLWRHRNGPVEPSLRLSDISYDPDSGELVRPQVPNVRAPESALTEYLAQARRELESATEWDTDEPAHGLLSPEFEHLRWFDLPTASLR
jgi:hypothetical protein